MKILKLNIDNVRNSISIVYQNGNGVQSLALSVQQYGMFMNKLRKGKTISRVIQSAVVDLLN